MRYLFIGGENDGRRIDLVEPLPTFNLPTSGDMEQYIRFDVRGEREIHRIYVICGMTADEVFEKLINTYKE